MNIPFFTLEREYQVYKKEIDTAMQRVLSSQQFILGKELISFESEFSQYLGVSHAIGVNSGTDGLILALRALGIGPGDKVITQANSFVATASAIHLVGATPVLVDVSDKTYQITIEEIEKKISKKTKAIIPVHLYGAPCEIDQIMVLAKKYRLFVIEDACQAHGSLYKKKRLGTFGDIGVFSFYPSKNLGGYGDGGALVTNSKSIARFLKMARNHGQEKKYFHDILGINSRLDEIQAAVLRIKLRHLDRANAKRAQLVLLYKNFLKDIKQQEILSQGISNYYLYTIEAKERDALQKFLLKQGIDTLVHYPIPIHLQKAFAFLRYKRGDFPVTEHLARHTVSLPLFFAMTQKEVKNVSEAVALFFKKSENKKRLSQ